MHLFEDESFFFFFLSGLSFTDSGNSQDSREREETFFYSTLPPHLQPSINSMVLLLFRGNILSSLFCQGRCVYLKTSIAAIHYIKRTGFTSRTTARIMKFSIKDFLSKCDQIRGKLRTHLLKKSLIENFIFCAVNTWRVLRLSEESNCSPCFFKVSFFFAELVALIFAWRLLCYAAILSWWMC